MNLRTRGSRVVSVDGDLTRDQEKLLAAIFPGDQMIVDTFRRWACSADASLYRLVPKAILRPQEPEQIKRLIENLPKLGLSVTFRGAGTSLSGQAVGKDLLVEVGWGRFRSFEVATAGRSVRFGPGVVGGMINAHLKAFGRKLGPDPASIQSAMMGGILANNSSGMCCGIEANSYRTLQSMIFVLADGYRIDSGAEGAAGRFVLERPELAQSLSLIRKRLLETPVLAEKVRERYKRKNTSGYGLNSFLDFEEPLDILTHLLIGSEGTLGFIEEAVLETVPDPVYKQTGLILFGRLEEAAEAVYCLRETGAAAVEILDSASLTAAQKMGVLGDVSSVIEPDHAALLVEYEADHAEPAAEAAARGWSELKRRFSLSGAGFTADLHQREQLWRMRKRLFPSVSGVRAGGTSVVIEDICVDVDQMPAVIRTLHDAFGRYGYQDHVIFGHAKDGNLHFVIHPDFSHQAGVRRYAGFLDEVMDKVAVTFGGSLKAEHGTGRNVASFLELEWGPELIQVMRDVKQLLDPGMYLNPGVIINDDPRCHLRHLKETPLVHPLIDGCMECGFCERVCPSKDLTLTPRQRITALRAMAHGRGGAEWEVHFDFQGVESCAADGMCASVCPVGINTGTMMKVFRARSKGVLARGIAGFLAKRPALAMKAVRLNLSFLRWFRASEGRRRVLGRLTEKRWGARLQIRESAVLPAPQRHIELPEAPRGGNPVLYFPTCLNMTFGALEGESQPVPLPVAVAACLENLGYSPFCPKSLRQLCCGTPFYSKGFIRAGVAASRETFGRLWTASDHGQIPVVTDVSPCALELKNLPVNLSDDPNAGKLKIYDLAEFAMLRQNDLPERNGPPVILHPTCSMVKQGTDVHLRALMNRLSRRVIVPHGWNCCGFAGDRGLLVPDLTNSATSVEAAEVAQLLKAMPDAVLLSSCRTCEMGMTQATGRVYSSFVFYLYEQLLTP